MSRSGASTTSETQGASAVDPRQLLVRAWALLIHPTRGPAPAPPRLTAGTVALIFALGAAWRVAIYGVSIAWARLGTGNPWPGDETYHVLWRYSIRWDSGWYMGVIQQGYFYDPERQSSIAFFPLFPYATRLFDWLLPGSEVFAGMLVVHLALLGALIYIYQLVRIDYPDFVAWRSLFFVLIFPTSIFFSAFYTEALLLFGFAGTLYHARRGQWLLAGIFGFFTGLTKLIGLVVIIPIALELIRQRAVSLRRPSPVLFSALAPAGAIGYFAWIHSWVGDFRAYFWNQEHWNRQSFDPEPFLMLGQYLTGNRPQHMPYPGESLAIHDLYFLVDMGSLMLFLAAGVYLWLRVQPSYGALVLAGAMVPALSGTPLAMARYMVILFPVFILVASIRNEAVRNAIAIVSVLLFGFFTYLFVNGFWTG